MSIQVGDWVKGKTGEDELFHGFIETWDALQGIGVVYVVKSDHERRIGSRAQVKASWISRMEDTAVLDSPLVSDLIDLALETGDEDWFNELTEGKKRRETEGKRRMEKLRYREARFNRLRKFV